MSKEEQPRLTQFSPGAGCGCKISPSVLENIIKTDQIFPKDERLLVGNDTRDDAAVYDLGNGQGVISTTDFFTPIADDPFDFGRIAAANAISDIYAMGGKPIMAISILGWPLEKLPESAAQKVLEGARTICHEAGISLAGGHSIDSMEPIFGLAVSGLVELKDLKKNDSAEEGCLLYLTKPLGIGALTTAEKQGKLQEAHRNIARDWMVKLNTIGAEVAQLEAVKAITDVTGFGLLGHAIEVAEGSGLVAEIRMADVPLIPEAIEYIEQGAIPGGTFRNWKSYGHKVEGVDKAQRMILCDPQTSGGLLIAVAPSGKKEVEALLESQGIKSVCLGEMKAQTSSDVCVIIR